MLTRASRGLTLIEIMIVIAILAIVVAVGYPVMTEYLQKARRGEAKAILQDLALRQERWRAENTTYAPDVDTLVTGVAPAVANPSTGNPYYTYDVKDEGAFTFTVEAQALGSQANDDVNIGGVETTCSPLTLNQSETRTPAACW
jgi:type IV pilus assembly protein PilE